MRIIRFPRTRITKELHLNETERRENICPFCGKELNFCDRRIRMYNKTTGDGLLNPYVFHTFSVNTYTCSRCYAIWESEPYEENPFRKRGINQLWELDLIRKVLDLVKIKDDEICDMIDEDSNGKDLIQ